MIRYNLIKTLLLGVIIVLSSASCSEEEHEGGPVIRPVRYQQVFATGGNRIRTFSGIARAGVESDLSFKVEGTIRNIAVKVGDHVEAGQLIARLDPRDYELQVEEARASLTQAEAEARNAAANHDRIRGLYENRNTSLNDLDAARAADESATAAVRSAENRLELARSKLGYTRLTAPVEGDIASLDAEVNEYVNTTVSMLTSGSRLEVEATIPGTLIAQVSDGQKVAISFDAIPSKEFSAIVTEVGVAATGLVTTFPVNVVLEEECPEIRSGMAAQVAFNFESSDKRERFVVPSVSVGEDRQGRFVFVVEQTEPGFGEVRKQVVTVGELTDVGLEVFEGLSDGDLVVTAGISKITHGQRVKLPGSVENQP
jgi:RND family efflux transporter MFP subunit